MRRAARFACSGAGSAAQARRGAGSGVDDLDGARLRPSRVRLQAGRRLLASSNGLSRTRIARADLGEDLLHLALDDLAFIFERRDPRFELCDLRAELLRFHGAPAFRGSRRPRLRTAAPHLIFSALVSSG